MQISFLLQKYFLKQQCDMLLKHFHILLLQSVLYLKIQYQNLFLFAFLQAHKVLAILLLHF
jgi:hypothetical protein